MPSLAAGPITLTINGDVYGGLVRVDRPNQSCGYIHLLELMNLIKLHMEGRGAGDNPPVTWIDMLPSKGMLIGMMVGRDAVKVILSFPRREMPILYNGVAGAITMSIPPVLWEIKFQGSRATMFRLYTTPIRVMSINDTVALYQWPYGNGNSDGSICWGTLPAVAVSLTDPAEVDRIFFSSPFNGDLTRPHQVVAPEGFRFTSLHDFRTYWARYRLAYTQAHKDAVNPWAAVPILDYAPGSLTAIRANIRELTNQSF